MKNNHKGLILPIIILLIVVLVSGGFYLYKQNKNSGITIYGSQNGNTLVGPNTKETRDTFKAVGEIQNAKDVSICAKYKGNGEFSCILNLAVKNKDYKLCENLMHGEKGDEEARNWCLSEYENVNPDINVCKAITEDGTERRGQCFYDITSIFQDVKTCDNFTLTKDKDACVKFVNKSIYEKKELCPSLYANNTAPKSSTDCFNYVVNLKDPKMCAKFQLKDEQDYCLKNITK